MTDDDTCPYSHKECERARLCVLERREACLRLISRDYTSCRKCKQANGNQCPFACFRVDNYGYTMI